MLKKSSLGAPAHGHRRLSMERLEDRSLMAGNVIVSITNGDVVVTGDGSSNSIEISQPSLDRFKITGLTHNGSATKLNGVANRPLFYNLTSFNDDIRITMNAGSDKLSIRGFDNGFGDTDAHDNLEVSMGSGNDIVTLRYVEAINGDVIVDLGTGTDTLNASYVDAGDDFIVDNSHTSRSRTVVKVNLDHIFATDQLDIDLWYSLDRVNIVNADCDDLLVQLRSGDDKLNIKLSESDVSSSLNGGDGNDDLNFYRNRTRFNHSAFKTPTSKDILYS